MRGNYKAASETFEKLSRLGIDMADVAESLERQGIATFVKSWNELIASVTEQLKAQGADVMPAGAVRPAAGTGANDDLPAAAAPAASR